MNFLEIMTLLKASQNISKIFLAKNTAQGCSDLFSTSKNRSRFFSFPFFETIYNEPFFFFYSNEIIQIRLIRKNACEKRKYFHSNQRQVHQILLIIYKPGYFPGFTTIPSLGHTHCSTAWVKVKLAHQRNPTSGRYIIIAH